MSANDSEEHREEEVRARPGAPPPDPGSTQEFEDEEPGSYLRELRLAPFLAAWAAINLSCGLAVPAVIVAFDPGGDDLPPLRMIWLLVPVSSVLLAVTVLWYAASRFTRRSRSVIAFALISAAVCVAAYLAGMLFASSHPLFAPPRAP